MINKGVKSDGGSSSYYFTPLPVEIIEKIKKQKGIELVDILRYVYDNDNDACNIVKAQKRIIQAKKGGGKDGIDAFYDMNKIDWFNQQQREAYEISQSEEVRL